LLLPILKQLPGNPACCKHIQFLGGVVEVDEVDVVGGTVDVVDVVVDVVGGFNGAQLV
jgi:hypothetical protein